MAYPCPVCIDPENPRPDRRLGPGLDKADRNHTGEVPVAARVVEQQVADGVDAQPMQPFAIGLTDAGKLGYRRLQPRAGYCRTPKR